MHEDEGSKVVLRDPSDRQRLTRIADTLSREHEILIERPALDRPQALLELREAGVPIRGMVVDVGEFRRYMTETEKAGIYDSYREEFGSYFERKYVSCRSTWPIGSTS